MGNDPPPEQITAEKIYKEYSTVFDYFSDDRFSPACKYFIEHVLELAKRKRKICEVGGGTGFFTQRILTQNPELELRFIEPSVDMLERAKARLGRSCQFFNNTFDKIQPKLGTQDVFLFQRSFYHLSKDHDGYKRLIAYLYRLTNTGGFVCIQHVPPFYDVEARKKDLRDKHIEYGVSMETFNQKWPILENTLIDFNNRIAREEYCYVSPDVLILFSRIQPGSAPHSLAKTSAGVS